jgi:hypothetical protein
VRIEPGGFVQWVDLEQDILLQGVPELNFCHGIPLQHAENTGMSLQFVTLLEQAFTASSLNVEVLLREEHRPAQRADLAETLKVWYLNAMNALIPPVWLRSGQAANEADAMVMFSELKVKVLEVYKAGIVPDMPIVTLVIQQKSKLL